MAEYNEPSIFISQDTTTFMIAEENIFQVDENSRLAVWIQLRNRLIFLIKRGDYAPGDQLPSVRSLAVSASINYNTVSKAYVDLEDAGYVKSVRGKGVFVTERIPSKEEKQDTREAAETEIRSCIKTCMLMGMSLDEVKLAMLDVIMKTQYEGKISNRGVLPLANKESRGTL